jgi:anti-anti-sigma factor
VNSTPSPREPRPRALPDCALLTLPPEIDLGNADDLLAMVVRALADEPEYPGVVVLDLTATDFMDSQGVRFVSTLRARLPATTELRLATAPRGLVARVLRLSGLRRDVPVYDDLLEAVAGRSYVVG